jgi:hypothetical protein
MLSLQNKITLILLKYKKILRITFPICVLIFFLLLSTYLYFSSKKEYNFKISQLSRKNSVYKLLSNEKSIIENNWINPGARMTARIILKNYEKVLSITDNLKIQGYLRDRSPFEIWFYRGKNQSEAIPYFYLSLLAGDISSARAIILNINFNKFLSYELDKNLLFSLTNTIWQSANEYLGELDFGRTAVYNNIYLECSKHILSDGLSFANNYARRNRTLSHILQNEIKSQRIKSLCNNKNLFPFGILLGADNFGYEIIELPGLNQRRILNSQFHCKDMKTTPPIDYSVLKDLKINSNEACRYFPVECEFNNFVDAIFKYINNETRWEPFNHYYFENCINDKNFFKNYSKQVLNALSFIKNCSYLSDDLLFILLEQVSFLDRSFSLIYKNQNPYIKNMIPIDVLDQALYCVESSNGDNKASAIASANELNCGLISWEKLKNKNFKIISQSMKSMVIKCEESQANLH